MNPRLIVSALLSLTLSAACAGQSQSVASGAPQGPQGAAANAPQMAAMTEDSSSYTYVVCYFIKGTETTHEWGLNGASSGYSNYQLTGYYKKTPYTGLEKFFTTVSQDDINTSCINAQTYHQLSASGYVYLAAFAANNATNPNYPILSSSTGNWVELWPMF